MPKLPRPIPWLRRRRWLKPRRGWFFPRPAMAHGRRASGSSTGEVLARLEDDGWEVCAADQLALGPGGVFLLETKRLEGLVLVEDGVLTTRSPDDGAVTWSDRRLRRWLRARAGSAAERIRRVGGVRRWVQPVVVIWGDFEQRRVVADGIAYVHGEELEDWLRTRPRAQFAG